MGYRYQDRDIINSIRRELIRRVSVDSTQVNVFCINGIVELSGSWHLSGMAHGLDPKTEFATFKDVCMRIPGVRDVTHRYLRVG